MSLSHTSISGLRSLLSKGEISARDIVDDLLLQTSQRDGEVGAFLSIDAERVRAAAAKADLSLPLGGIPIAIKDNINTRDEPCTCGSRFLSENYR
ncbi:MAG: Asp-tRNA(Asn)/Glu-tRNA(Gln) amidotransferase subunit GatA, partial [Verrucomicrobiota bacterium]